MPRGNNLGDAMMRRLFYDYREDAHWGVLETPCFPASFYAGQIVNYGDGWVPRDNATCNYHRSEGEAFAAIIKILENRR